MRFEVGLHKNSYGTHHLHSIWKW